MRVLVVSNYYPPHHLGGQELEAEEIVAGVRARGHHAEVLTSRHGSGPTSADRVHRLLWPEMDLRPRWPALHFFTARRRRRAESVRLTRETVERVRPDAALVQGMWNIPRDVPRVLEEELGARVVYRFADYWPALPSQHEHYWRAPGRGIGRLLKPPLAAIALRLIESPAPLRIPAAVCVSHATLRELQHRGVSLPDARVLWTGLDPGPFAQAGERREDADAVRLLYAGRVAPEKGLDVALEAIAALGVVGERVRLTIAGPGSDADVGALRRLSARLGIDALVRFEAPRARDAMPDLYAAHDVFLHPARWPEPLARALMEAMASGMAVVASAVGGTPEIVEDGRSGVLVPPGNAGALAGALERVVDDATLRRDLGAAGRARVLRHFRLEPFLDRMVEILERAARTPAADRSARR